MPNASADDIKSSRPIARCRSVGPNALSDVALANSEIESLLPPCRRPAPPLLPHSAGRFGGLLLAPVGAFLHQSAEPIGRKTSGEFLAQAMIDRLLS